MRIHRIHWQLMLILLFGMHGMLSAQGVAPPPLVKESLVKVSTHVHIIPDDSVPMVPNVGIIVGNHATLVVDTGLGVRNAATILRQVAKVSKNPTLYLVSTHFHPEHLLGVGGFPASTKLILARAQQQDIDEFGYELRDIFSQRSAAAAELLKDATYRKADIIFERDHELNLGGVTVQLSWVGPTHTRGDTIIYVKQDRVLFSGDVVMNHIFPSLTSPYSSIEAWQRSLTQLEKLNAKLLVPSHGATGDASLIDAYRQYFSAVVEQTRALKAAGQSPDAAVTQVTNTLTTQLNWKSPDRIAAAVRTTYAAP